MRRMNEKWLPRSILEWCPVGRRIKGRPKFFYAESKNWCEKEGN